MGHASILTADALDEIPAEVAVRPAVAPGAPRVYALIAGTVVLTATAMAWRGLSLVGPDFPVLGVAAGLLLLVSLCLRARGWRRTATLIETWTLTTAFCVVATLLLFALGAGVRPWRTRRGRPSIARCCPGSTGPTRCRR